MFIFIALYCVYTVRHLTSKASVIQSPLSNPMSNLINTVELILFSSTLFYKLLYSVRILNDNEKLLMFLLVTKQKLLRLYLSSLIFHGKMKYN